MKITHHCFLLVYILFQLILPVKVLGSLSGCPVFPRDNIWNTPVDRMPLHPDSAIYVETLGAGKALFPDFGASELHGGRVIPRGIPINIVTDSTPLKEVFFGYQEQSDPGPYPIPDNPLIEGVLPGKSSLNDGNRHLLLVNIDSCMLYEIFYAWPMEDGTWHAGSGAVFDLYSNQLRGENIRSADPAGLPILPGLVRFEEVKGEGIRHALRFTAPGSHVGQNYVWPARHRDRGEDDAAMPPMGQRFRLRADFDLSPFSDTMRVILQAMQKYGIILADEGHAWHISGTADERWDNELLQREFQLIKGADFEAVDISSLLNDPDSGQISSNQLESHSSLAH